MQLSSKSVPDWRSGSRFAWCSPHSNLRARWSGFRWGWDLLHFLIQRAVHSQVPWAGSYANMAALLFLALNGHLMVIMAVVHSFAAFPVDQQNSLQALASMKLQTLGAELFASAFWIALPVIAMLMFANLALGIVSRVAPQMNIYAIGFPVTLAVGLVGVVVTLPLLENLFAALMSR